MWFQFQFVGLLITVRIHRIFGRQTILWIVDLVQEMKPGGSRVLVEYIEVSNGASDRSLLFDLLFTQYLRVVNKIFKQP